MQDTINESLVRSHKWLRTLRTEICRKFESEGVLVDHGEPGSGVSKIRRPAGGTAIWIADCNQSGGRPGVAIFGMDPGVGTVRVQSATVLMQGIHGGVVHSNPLGARKRLNPGELGDPDAPKGTVETKIQGMTMRVSAPQVAIDYFKDIKSRMPELTGTPDGVLSTSGVSVQQWVMDLAGRAARQASGENMDPPVRTTLMKQEQMEAKVDSLVEWCKDTMNAPREPLFQETERPRPRPQPSKLRTHHETGSGRPAEDPTQRPSATFGKPEPFSKSSMGKMFKQLRDHQKEAGSPASDPKQHPSATFGEPEPSITSRLARTVSNRSQEIIRTPKKPGIER